MSDARLSTSLVEAFMALEAKVRKTYGMKTELEVELEAMRVEVIEASSELGVIDKAVSVEDVVNPDEATVTADGNEGDG